MLTVSFTSITMKLLENQLAKHLAVNIPLTPSSTRKFGKLFLKKGQAVNVFDFASPTVSVRTTQLCAIAQR